MNLASSFRRPRYAPAALLVAAWSLLAFGCGGREQDDHDDAGATIDQDDAARSAAEVDALDAARSEPEADASTSGQRVDAGRADASAPRDAGHPLDAGRGPDAAPAREAGTDTDAAVPSAPGGITTDAPETWTEHWFEHNQTLTRVAQNDWVVLYFDADVSRTNTTWLLPFLTRVWQYTVAQYGQFTDGQRDGRLYAIYHQGRYSGGHPATYFDASHDYRNVSDVGPGPYPDGSYAISTHEVSHIVEGASRGMQGSPAFGIWGDSKWAEFYQYDLYVALGLDKEAQRVYDEFSRKSDGFPRAGTFWFRDWFYPLWKDHGGVRVMVRYFELLAQHFRRSGKRFGAGMNMGEFIHFMSGAANTNLKAQATNAFGWSDSREAEFVKAQKDFAGIKY